MSAYIPLACALFGIFVAIILVLSFPISCCSLQKEGFQDINIAKVKCPRGTKTYTTLSGDTMCCNGNIVGNKCEGKIICTLSGNSSNKVPTCAKLRQDYLAKLQLKCPVKGGFISYEDDDTGKKGCAVQTTVDRSQPQTPTTSYCRLYDDKIDNENYQDSCQNVEKNSQFSTVFMNTVRPNFCLDVDEGFIEGDKKVIGMAPCNGSDSQAFRINDKGHVLNKKGGLLVFLGGIFIFRGKQVINEILNNNVSILRKIPISGNTFKIGIHMNDDMYYYGLYGTGNQPVTIDTPYNHIWSGVRNSNEMDITRGGGEWRIADINSIKR
jgi:hypothetical protein